MILITDANIWIDLDNGNLLGIVFGLSHEFAVPDVIIRELEETVALKILDYGVRRLELPAEQYAELEKLRREYRGPSVQDLHGLLHAQMLGAHLLTGDRNLRTAAENEGVTVSGLLWLMDELVNEGVVVGQRAAYALGRMLREGARLPVAECNRRLAAWNSGTG